MKDGRYDVVHSHELFHSGIVLRIAYKAGIKKESLMPTTGQMGMEPEEKEVL